MSSQKGARSKLADVLADIKNSRVEDEFDYNNRDATPAPSKRRHAGVNYVALSGHTPRQSRSSTSNTNNTPQPNNSESKTEPIHHSTPSAARTRTYILKLFDRSVDLAQFTESDSGPDVPLYPICRAWVHDYRLNQTQNKSPFKQIPKSEKSNGSPLTASIELTNETASDVHSLPPAKSIAETIERFKINVNDVNKIDLRIPQSVRDFKRPENIEEIIDRSIQSTEREECMDSNKKRWKKVRRDWSAAREIHESRYEESFKILNDLFMSSQRGV